MMFKKEKLKLLIKKYNLQNYFEKQLPIEAQSPEWEKIINIACEIEKYVVEKNNLQKTHWIKKEWGIQNSDIGIELYYQIEDQIMELFNVVEQR